MFRHNCFPEILRNVLAHTLCTDILNILYKYCVSKLCRIINYLASQLNQSSIKIYQLNIYIFTNLLYLHKLMHTESELFASDKFKFT